VRIKPPSRTEPVKATTALHRAGRPEVYLLTPDGLRTKTMLPVENGTVALDTAHDRAPCYLVEF